MPHSQVHNAWLLTVPTEYLHEAPARVVAAFWLPYAINKDLLLRCASLSFLSSPPTILPSSLDE